MNLRTQSFSHKFTANVKGIAFRCGNKSTNVEFKTKVDYGTKS